MCPCVSVCVLGSVDFVTMIMVIKSVWVLMRPWVIITDSWNGLLANRPQIIALTKWMDNKHSFLCAVITQPYFKNNYGLAKPSLSNYNTRFCTDGINYPCPKLVKQTSFLSYRHMTCLASLIAGLSVAVIFSCVIWSCFCVNVEHERMRYLKKQIMFLQPSSA